MKKIMIILAAAALLFGCGGQAMANFADGDLIQVIYQTGVTTGNEYITDLGQFGTLTAPTTTDQVFANINLFGLGALNIPGSTYQVAYFSYDSAMGSNGTIWVSGSSVVPSTPRSGGNKFFSGFTSVEGAFNQNSITASGFTVATVSQGNAFSYMQAMDNGVAGEGTFNGFLTKGNGEATITGSYVDQYLYYFATPNTASSALEVADIRTYSDGHTEILNPNTAQPVPPVISKQFGLASISLNGSTSLSFTVQNNNASSQLSQVGFSDTLPAGLVVSTPNALIGSCDSGSITATQGTNVISLSGATLAASNGTSCNFSVNVTGIAAGNQQNTTGNVTSMEGGSGNTASASIQVIAPPTLAESFNPISIPLQTTTSLTYNITKHAANAVALTGVAFSDTLPTGTTVVDSSSTVCGGTLTTTAATGLINLSGASIAVNSQCQFPVTTTGAAVGYYTNTTGTVTSSNGGNGNAAVANLTVNDGTDFIGTPTSGSIPLYVSFTDESTDSPTSWLWDFGDGSNSKLQNPGHNYTQQGSFTVTLTATGTGGPVIMPKTGYISVSPCGNQPVMVDGTPAYFSTIQDAFNSALTSGETVQVQALDMPENSLTWDQNISVVLSGGYGCDYTANPGFTTVLGTLTIKAGTMNVYNVILR